MDLVEPQEVKFFRLKLEPRALTRAALVSSARKLPCDERTRQRSACRDRRLNKGGET